ncbi:MAG TPA: zinc ribbon domain-containing protein [Myxococcota bacterium]|nr:zinc ribbon domain-containing protein [Myxococcota bacterium]
MPIYEYACEKCGHEFEREQRITDEPVKTCPSCRARKVRRLISRTAFVLKGSGWYSDLYASPKPGQKEGASGDKEGAATGKEAAAESAAPSGDSKPASDGKSGSESKPASKSKGKSKKPKAAA